MENGECIVEKGIEWTRAAHFQGHGKFKGHAILNEEFKLIRFSD